MTRTRVAGYLVDIPHQPDAAAVPVEDPWEHRAVDHHQQRMSEGDTISVEAVVSTTVPTTMARTNGPGSISR